MPTLKEVAEICGVSTATVSHVIHGRTDRVGAPTRERVMQVLRDLRHPSATSTRAHRTLALVAANTDPHVSGNVHLLRFLDGWLDESRRQGFDGVLHFTRGDTDADELPDRLARDSAGVALIFHQTGSDLPVRLVERGTPLVTVGATLDLPGASTVDVDNVAYGVAAVRHLAALGHRRIAFCGLNEVNPSSWERVRGYRQALREQGLAGEYELILPGGYVEDDGAEMARHLLTHPDRAPTAVVAANDQVAEGLVRAMAVAGWKVPRDLSVVSIDDGPSALRCQPPLTTFRQPLEALGIRAAQILADKVQDPGRPDETVRYSLEFVERSSTGPVRQHPPAFSIEPPSGASAVVGVRGRPTRRARG